MKLYAFFLILETWYSEVLALHPMEGDARRHWPGPGNREETYRCRKGLRFKQDTTVCNLSFTSQWHFPRGFTEMRN